MSYKIATAVGAFFLASQPAQAATIDVDNLLIGDGKLGSSGIGGSIQIAPDVTHWGNAFQTWTVGQTGFLSQIDIFSHAVHVWSPDGIQWGGQDYDFLVTLTILGGGTATTPGTTELGSVSKSAAEIGPITTTAAFDVSSLGIRASQGDVLTLKMSVDRCEESYCSTTWYSPFIINGIGNTNGYAGGSAFTQTKYGQFDFGYAYDLNFRTWMSAVPEPSTWAMMIVGFGAAGAMIRSTRRFKTPSII